MNARIEQIKERLAKIIPAPWELTPEEWPDRGSYQTPEVYSIADPQNPRIVCTVAVRAEWEENGSFIAAAPEDRLSTGRSGIQLSDEGVFRAQARL